jgi:hypothetical protein
MKHSCNKEVSFRKMPQITKEKACNRTQSKKVVTFVADA